MANLQLVYKEICQVSFQAINNFLLNQNNVDFQNNVLDLQSNDLTNLKFSDNSLSNLSKDSVALVHQIIVVDKFRLDEQISTLPKEILSQIDSQIDYVLK